MAVQSACMSMRRCVVLSVSIVKWMMTSIFSGGTVRVCVSPFAYVALAVVTCILSLV